MASEFPYSNYAYDYNFEHGESGELMLEFWITPYDYASSTGPENALESQLVEDQLVGVGWSTLDFDGDKMDGHFNLAHNVRMEAHYIPHFDAEQKVIGYFSLGVDITERKRAEEERRSIDQKLQETQRLESLGPLAGGIAHDFNNLLTGILGNASLSRMELPKSSPVLPHMESIEATARHAADLCKQMLAYSERGRFVIDNLNMNTTVEGMSDLLHLSISKSAVLRFDLADDLPLTKADASQIRHIILNLVINASEAIGNRSGLIVVSTGATRADEDYLAAAAISQEIVPGDYVFVEVSDNGCGMDEDARSRIFDPFFTTKFTGRGLGLAAVQGIVRGHNGALTVYSEPGKGQQLQDVTALQRRAGASGAAVIGGTDLDSEKARDHPRRR